MIEGNFPQRIEQEKHVVVRIDVIEPLVQTSEHYRRQ
jgi:hypothetical protein